MKKISVITINFNNIAGLRDTLRSVRVQSNKEFEYIVIDGGSTDGSKELLEDNKDIIDVLISEPDKGIYDAMNKGTAHAHGEYVMFVNSGDKIADADTMEKLSGMHLESDICFCKVRNRNANGKKAIWCPPLENKLSLQFLRWNTLHHPGAIIKRDLQCKIPYNINLKICSDRQFFIHALILENASYQTLDIVLNEFAPAGTSGSDATQKMEDEAKIILDTLFTERQRRDIEKNNFMIQEISEPLTHYFGKTKFICAVNGALFKILKIK